MKINWYTSNTQRKMSSLDDEIFGRDGESMCFNLWATAVERGCPQPQVSSCVPRHPMFPNYPSKH